MKTFVLKMIGNFIVTYMTKHKEKVVLLLAEKTDIPQLDEAEEIKVYSGMYDALQNVLLIVFRIVKEK